jgi:signal transduction histidine kinase
MNTDAGHETVDEGRRSRRAPDRLTPAGKPGQVEEQLARSERRHRLLFETMLQGVVYQDADGKILSMNPAAERILGKTPTEFLGRTSVDEEHHTIREDGSFFPGLEHPSMVSLRTGQEVRDVVMGVYNPWEEAYRWINITAVPLFRPGQDKPYQVYTCFDDITARRQAEQALRELNATLESRVAQRTAELEHRARQLQKLTLDLSQAEDRERKRLAEILHDDLQQVLAAAKFHLGLLNGRMKEDAESQEITTQVKDLLKEAIDKSRSLSHELISPALSHSDLLEIFEWLAEQMQTKHGLMVHLEACDRIELPSESLRALLYKAAQELLFNVIKHAGVGEATLRLRRRRGRIRLSVSDQGRGFDPTESGHALGFGLLSIRERVELLGGRMKIRSAKGKGSTFLIAVPDSEVREGE